MKTTLIVIISFLLVVSTALLGYGISQGTQKELDSTAEAMYEAPARDLFLGEYAEQKIDVSAIYEDSGKSKADKIAQMIINASYNNIMINQFYYAAHVEVKGSGKESYSDYFRAKTGANMFYQTFAYTGVLNPAVTRIDYVDQRLSKTTTTTYDKKEKTWAVSFKSPDVDNKDPMTLPDLNAYNIYSWYDFPLDLGGVKNHINDDTRTEAIDSSLIDPTSATIELVDADGENPYYRLTFKAIIAAAQASGETLARFSESFDSLSNIQFSELTFTVEIWKDMGVFRRIDYYARVTATISGNRGEARINKTIGFSYDDEDASVAYHIKKLADQHDSKWISRMSKKNRDILNAEVAELEAKIAAKEAAEQATELEPESV
ncbi:MAG TPA: hypothetical protein DHV31_00495 [Clostridiales bacterium]|nr:hypothetical protein [Clostridiales bacterium]